MRQVDKNTQVLSHMYNYCDKISHTIERFGADFDVFADDSDYVDSISMNILQIGELVSKLSDDFITATNHLIPWREMKAMRNFFAHDYGSMNIDIIWETAINDIPYVKDFCRPYYEEYQKACAEIEDTKFD